MRDIFFIMPALTGGGAERVVSILANYFVNQCNVTVCLVEKDTVDYTLDSRISINTSALGSERRGIGKVFSKLISIRKWMLEHPDAVFISFMDNENILTSFASVGLPVRVVLSQRNDPFQTLKNHILKCMTFSAYKLNACKSIVFQTEGAKEFYPESIQKKGRIILNPLKENLPEPFDGTRSKRIVSVARLEPQKNYPMLITAFSEFYKLHPDYVLEIYGEGTEKENLLSLTRQLGIEGSVVFCGFEKSIHEKILDASMFVLASDYEGLSNAMLESLALGLPTICTDCSPGGARMVIQSGQNGLLVPVRATNELCAAMCEVAENHTLAEHLSHEAVSIRKELCIQEISRQWESLLEEL